MNAYVFALAKTTKTAKPCFSCLFVLTSVELRLILENATSTKTRAKLHIEIQH